ncbi:MAG: OmpW family protein [Verrucomicrobia bacterium]|nr:OmpW family protein [Verrucomicrobiota bacterium]
MRTLTTSLAALACLAAPAFVAAAEPAPKAMDGKTAATVLQPSPEPGPWSLRLGATYLDPVNGSSNRQVPVTVESKWMPELDVMYNFTKNCAAELVLTIPQRHSVSSNGVRLGHLNHLPPTLLFRYTLPPLGPVRFYIGAGVNMTFIRGHLINNLKLDSFSAGPAGQAGVEWHLTKRWVLNFDVKRMYLRSDVTLNGARVTEVKVDPWLYTFGVRYRF